MTAIRNYKTQLFTYCKHTEVFLVITERKEFSRWPDNMCVFPARVCAEQRIQKSSTPPAEIVLQSRSTTAGG